MERKIILITGASSGFGWLIAKSCAALGHKVYATMRHSKTTNAAKAQALAQDANIRVVEMELTAATSVASAISSVIKEEGRIDVLVNNAGVFATGIAETFTEDDLEKVMNVNVKGAWRAIRAVLPQMRSRGDGLIVNISSISGRFAAPFMGIYNSSKFALEGLTESLHYEVRPLGVDVAMVQPGAFPTEIFGKLVPGSDNSIAEGYGELANAPAKMGAGVMQLFETVKPDPQMVADAVAALIEMPKGKRPLRTVIDVATGPLVEAANHKVQEQYVNFLTAFGMQGMLN